MADDNFKILIKPKTGWRDIDFAELWRYRELMFMFVKRNFATRYKQTILGPAWLIISPLMNTIISTFVFGTIAGIPSEGVPYFLFYMCGYTAWNYFSSCLVATSSTFTGNAAIFGKVYFPRLVMPVATVCTSFFDYLIQFFLFIAFWLYFLVQGAEVALTGFVWLIPIMLIQMAALGLGCGIIISSLTTKYRDLTVLVSFGVSLWMYITPVIYAVSSLPEKIKALCMLNPMAPIIEMMRYALLGTGEIPVFYWGISVVTTTVILAIGVILFSKVEKTFIDTV